MRVIRSSSTWTMAGTCLAALMACGGGGGGGGTPDAPRIAITATSGSASEPVLAFGEVAQGYPAQLVVTVANAGTAPLVIGDVGLADPLSLPFSILADGCSQETIAPNGWCEITVGFTPGTAAEATDTFDVPSSDAALPTVTVQVSGTGGVLRRAFVTSVTGTGNLSTWAGVPAGTTGIAAGDAVCRARAAAAGLDNANGFIAWLSDDTTDAGCHVHGLTGSYGSCGLAQRPEDAGPWIRTDGQPFAGDMYHLVRGEVYLPLNVDEFGDPVAFASNVTGTLVFTGTSRDAMLSEASCQGWTSGGTDAAMAGTTSGTTETWTRSANWAWCDDPHPIFCLETGHGAPLPPFETHEGRRVFVTSTYGTGNLSSWSEAGGQTGIAAGDAICRARATAAELPSASSFKAWLSDGSTEARDRIAGDGPWVRVDGLLVASTRAELLGSVLVSPFGVTESGYYTERRVWTGTNADGTRNSWACDGWTTNSATRYGEWGESSYAAGGWTATGSSSCDNTHNLYCVEDP